MNHDQEPAATNQANEVETVDFYNPRIETLLDMLREAKRAKDEAAARYQESYRAYLAAEGPRFETQRRYDALIDAVADVTNRRKYVALEPCCDPDATERAVLALLNEGGDE